MLKYRLLTAVVLLPLMIAAILKLPTYYFLGVLGLITLMGAWEWSALIPLRSISSRILYVVLILAAIYFCLGITQPVSNLHSDWLMLMVAGTLYWIWMLFAVMRFNSGKSPLGIEFPSLRVFSGFVFFVAGFIAIIAMRSFSLEGAEWLLLMIIVIMAADSGAYFSGRCWGRKPLAERVSPKKTWAGFWGGLVAASIVSVIGAYFLGFDPSQIAVFWCLGIIATFFSIIGDLSVSVMKRQVSLKDTGTLLPGHGGFLDRMDSVFSGMVIFALGFLWL